MSLLKFPLSWLLILTVAKREWGVLSQDEGTITVNLRQGEVFALREMDEDGKVYYSFKGIPYALPPIDGLRFRDPIPPTAWGDTLDGSVAGPVCPQLDVEALQKGNIEVKGNEDCLYLNVFSPNPQESANLPVIVWIHGGAFISGGAEKYAPMALLGKDIVLVSIQYRLGALGFLSTQDDVLPGNLALKDQTMALKWVKENIRNLGGDPERITLMGQSSGAVSAHFQVLAPSAKGLFQRAVLQSGSSLSPWALRNDHWKVAHMIGQMYNCSGVRADPPALDSTSLLYCLQELDVLDLVVLPSFFTIFQNAPTVMVPRVDGTYIPDHPAALLKSGHYNKVDLISGFNKDEGALEAVPLLLNANLSNEIAMNFDQVAPTMLKIGDEDQAPVMAESIFKYYIRNIPHDIDPEERLVQMLSDGGFKVPQDEVALLHGTEKNVYVYELQHRGQYSTTDIYNDTLGKNWVSHADELQYLYRDNPYFPSLERDEDLRVRDMMLTLWTNFAATGLPTPDSNLGFVWLPATRFCLRYLAITPNPFLQSYDRGFIAEFWRNLPLARNRILYPERFTFRGPFFFQPPVVPVTACLDLPGPGLTPGFGGGVIGGPFGGNGFGGSFGGPGNSFPGGFVGIGAGFGNTGNGFAGSFAGTGNGFGGNGGRFGGGSLFNNWVPSNQFSHRDPQAQKLEEIGKESGVVAVGGGAGNGGGAESASGGRLGGGTGNGRIGFFDLLPTIRLDYQKVEKMQEKLSDFLGI